MKARWVLLVVCAVACGETAGGAGDAADDAAAEVPVSIADGVWHFRVDRAWDGQSRGTGLPADPLIEADYVPVSEGSEYSVVVSDSASHVSIGDTPIEGQVTLSVDDRVTYDLNDGTFAGGRFVVWEADLGLQAELTIYGSGLPIVASERGDLIPQD